MEKGSKMTKQQIQNIKDGLKKSNRIVWNKGLTKKTDKRLNYNRPTLLRKGSLGQKSIAWKGGRAEWFRKKIINNKNVKCEFCSEKRKKFLIIHHKDLMGTIYESNGLANLENNRIDNLMILCRKCHNKLHIDIKKSNAIVLLSSGQDSTTCLVWAIKNFNKVITISFDYQQKHSIELEQAKVICKKLNIENITIDTSFINKITNNALTRKEIKIEKKKDSLPTTFVAGRNLFFLSIAGAIAYEKGIKNIITGVCETDYSGYPDCRDEFIKSLNNTLNVAMDYNFKIYTPLMWLTKKEEVLLMKKLKGLNLLKYSHTCYEGKRPACGKCPACKLRLKGFKEANIKDPLKYE